MRPSHRPSSRRRFLLLLLLLPLGLLALALARVGPAPRIEVTPGLPALGPRTPVAISVAEPERGLSTLVVELIQGERRHELARRSFRPRPFWAFWGPRIAEESIALEIGKQTHPDLEPGTATIEVVAERAPTWLRSPGPVKHSFEIPVRLDPPSLAVTSSQVNVTQGGSGVVRYRVGESAVVHGVEAGGYFFPGAPLPETSPQEQFSLFGAPYDAADASGIALVARDELGNESRRSFIDTYEATTLRTDTIRLSDTFMERVVPQILAETPELQARETLLDSYLLINRDLRRTNTAFLAELAATSASEPLWRGAFRQQPGTRSMASFADRRTYLYEGEDVDQQDHLGFDLASVRRAPVPAANAGVVVLAEYFGIYGNTVIVDHGLGLLSLYAHLSGIEVAKGEAVASGQVLGRSGQTGLAGGDHLHFSMILRGQQVNPLEWWDPEWIRNRVVTPLTPLFPDAE